MIKGIIFDLDGVIVKTDELHYRAWKRLADAEGIFFDREINNHLRGVSRMASLEIILERSPRTYSAEEKNRLASIKNQYYVELLKTLKPDDIMPGVTKTLEELKRRKILTAIGSSSKNARAILEQIKLANVFDAVADGNDIINSKPAPDVFLKAADMLGLRPAECAVVEDAEAGIAAAKSAGMLAIAIFDAKRSRLADHKLEDIGELINIIFQF
ncbi:MAG: beta-phosphoglucomutase [Bacillota bacterium]|nr:beta-phosphoglucomutase [Bacillota bacterium]